MNSQVYLFKDKMCHCLVTHFYQSLKLYHSIFYLHHITYQPQILPRSTYYLLLWYPFRVVRLEIYMSSKWGPKKIFWRQNWGFLKFWRFFLQNYIDSMNIKTSSKLVKISIDFSEECILCIIYIIRSADRIIIG